MANEPEPRSSGEILLSATQTFLPVVRTVTGIVWFPTWQLERRLALLPTMHDGKPVVALLATAP